MGGKDKLWYNKDLIDRNPENANDKGDGHYK